MHRKPASKSSRPWIQWPREHAFAIRLANCFVLVAVASEVVRILPQAKPPIWVANGVLLTYLLLAPRRRWAAYLAAAFAAQIASCVLLRPYWQINLLLTALNLFEVLIGAVLLRPRSSVLPRFTDREYLLRFVAYGVLAGPLASGLIYAPIAALWLHAAPVSALLQWVAADGLGIAIATPALLTIFKPRFRSTLNSRWHWCFPVVLLMVTYAAFAQNTVPLMYLIYPLLVLVLLRLGTGYASLSMLFVAVIVGALTIRGSGPFAAAGAANPGAPALLLQIAVASAIFMIYSVSVVLEGRKLTESRLRQIVTLHALVDENSRDAILLADINGRRSYASAAVQRLVEWSPDEFAKIRTLDLVHPDDLPKAQVVLRQLLAGAEGAMIECRVRKRNGEYIWVEASLRVVRQAGTGAPFKVLNIVRDITERKRAEQQLQEAYNALEALAVTDALTGLANRRRFDQCLTSEWRRGLRDRKPLSLLMIDADLFKSYNDTYGHLRGDSCLRQIAEAALDVVARPGDLVARFGGEEFAVILPNTDSEGALDVAGEICAALRSRKLPHSGNPFGIMTVSVGCATLIPSFGLHSVNLIEFADEALYKAKKEGRNRVCCGSEISSAASESLDDGATQTAVGKTA